MYSNNVSHPKASENQIIFSSTKAANSVTGFLIWRGIPFRAAVGKWKGEVENSWIIEERNRDTCEHLWKGEKFLLILGSSNGGRRKASLQDLLNHTTSEIGIFKEISKEEYAFADGATAAYVGDNLCYFGVATE